MKSISNNSYTAVRALMIMLYGARDYSGYIQFIYLYWSLSRLHPTLCGYSPFQLQEIYQLWT